MHALGCPLKVPHAFATNLSIINVILTVAHAFATNLTMYLSLSALESYSNRRRQKITML